MQLQIRLNLKTKCLVDSPTGVSTRISYKDPNFTGTPPVLSSSSTSFSPTLVLLFEFSMTMNNATRNPEATHSALLYSWGGLLWGGKSSGRTKHKQNLSCGDVGPVMASWSPQRTWKLNGLWTLFQVQLIFVAPPQSVTGYELPNREGPWEIVRSGWQPSLQWDKSFVRGMCRTIFMPITNKMKVVSYLLPKYFLNQPCSLYFYFPNFV